MTRANRLSAFASTHLRLPLEFRGGDIQLRNRHPHQESLLSGPIEESVATPSVAISNDMEWMNPLLYTQR